ncbi:MAG: rRNA pseudouridine synthase [Deltaproteobacteria bacterium]|nr:rRNA pseudouridine synthase [Deltaproteobacteria bacterium]
MAERLHVVLARAGIASRRHAENLISQGRVTVNGEVVVKPGIRVTQGKDTIRVDGHPVHRYDPPTTVVLNKPRGVVTTARDPRNRPTAVQLVEVLGLRLFPVGRLDYATEGLLLLTNDGQLAHRLQHPRFGVEKTYEAKVKGDPPAAKLSRLRTGVLLEGRRTAPARVRRLKRTAKNTWLEITIKEGRNRQVRRMCAAVGHPVLKLKRTGYGPLRLGGLKPGAFRELSRRELGLLRKACGAPVDGGQEKTP